MNTNFFNQVAQMNITGDLHLTISKGAENRFVVAVVLQNEQCGDDAKNIIPPLNVRGTAEELDEGFFQQITAPMQAVSGLMVNMEAFMKQVEEAKKQSAIEKAKSDKEKKEQETKNKKYMEAMVKVDELAKAGKYKEAWMKVPEGNDYPDKVEEIRKRKSELSGKFAPDLFGATVAVEKPEPVQDELYPAYAVGAVEQEMDMEDEDEQDEDEHPLEENY